MDVKEEAILGPDIKAHWYYVAKGRALRAILKDISPVTEVLDVGAGSGIFTRQLLEMGLAKRGVCVDPAYETERVEGPIRFVRAVETISQKVILMMDVLEHVDDDVGLLMQYTADMPRDGCVLATVPAFQWLWSGHDVFLEHRRRYTLCQFEEVMRRAGLTVLRSRYFFGALFPVIAAMRMGRRMGGRHDEIGMHSDLRPLPPWLNRALIHIHDVERAALFPVNRFAGLSIFCLARPDAQ